MDYKKKDLIQEDRIKHNAKVGVSGFLDKIDSVALVAGNGLLTLPAVNYQHTFNFLWLLETTYLQYNTNQNTKHTIYQLYYCPTFYNSVLTIIAFFKMTHLSL